MQTDLNLNRNQDRSKNHAIIAWFKYSKRLYHYLRFFKLDYSSPLTQSLDLLIDLNIRKAAARKFHSS